MKNKDKWLLTNLPSNTKYIVSTIPDHGNLLDMILKLIRKRYHQQLESTNVLTRTDPSDEAYKRYFDSK